MEESIMRIICDVKKLTEVCLNVQRCIPNRSVMPHLEGILIKTLPEGKIELSGFNLELGIVTEMEVRVEQPGAVVLPGYGVRSARIEAMPAEIDRFLKEGGFIEGEFDKLEDFSEVRPVTEAESAIFDAAVGTYPMIQANATKVSSRPVVGGTEYIFEAESKGGMPGSMKVHVLNIDGRDPEFTRVDR